MFISVYLTEFPMGSKRQFPLCFFSILILFLSTTSNADNMHYELFNAIFMNAYILAPKTDSSLSGVALLMGEEMYKMGIDNDLFYLGPILTNPRTFQNQLGTPENGIPDFKHGGFDIFITNISSNFPYNPSLFYSTDSYAPNGKNIAYFQNNTMDDLIKTYNQTIDPVERISLGYQIQQIAYEEVPYIPIVSLGNLWVYSHYLNLLNSSLLMIALQNFNSYWSKLLNKSEMSYTINNIIYYTPSVINKFLPNIPNSFSESLLLSSLWSKLYERNPIDPLLSYQPVMALSMPVFIDSSKTIAQIRLRDNVTFSNGDPLTSQDIVNTYRMAMTPAFGFTNYQKYLSLFDTANYGNNSVTAINSTTVQFRLKNPYFDAISLFNEPVLDQNVVGTYTNPVTYDLNSDPLNFSIGSGPFKLDSINSTTNTINLIRNLNWWAENITDWFGGFTSELNSITFKYDVSKSDALYNAKNTSNYILDRNYNFIPKDVSNIQNLDYQSEPNQQMIIIAVNMHNPYFGTGLETTLGKSNPVKAAEAARYIRLAIAYMVPQQDIIESLYHGNAFTTTTLWPPYLPGYNSSLLVRGFDLQKARKLVAMAGYDIFGYTPPSNSAPYYSGTILGLVVIAIINLGKKRRNQK